MMITDLTTKSYTQTKMDSLILKWYNELMADTDDSFESLYGIWQLDCFFGTYAVQFEIPSLEVCSDALNDQGINWERFNSFFQEHLTIKK